LKHIPTDDTQRDDEDVERLNESKDYLSDLITAELKTGFPSARIFMAGVGNGGAAAMYQALFSPSPQAGIAVLSGYIPARPLIIECRCFCVFFVLFCFLVVFVRLLAIVCLQISLSNTSLSIAVNDLAANTGMATKRQPWLLLNGSGDDARYPTAVVKEAFDSIVDFWDMNSPYVFFCE
jgi:hypothetical protein